MTVSLCPIQQVSLGSEYCLSRRVGVRQHDFMIDPAFACPPRGSSSKDVEGLDVKITGIE